MEAAVAAVRVRTVAEAAVVAAETMVAEVAATMAAEAAAIAGKRYLVVILIRR